MPPASLNAKTAVTRTAMLMTGVGRRLETGALRRCGRACHLLLPSLPAPPLRRPSATQIRRRLRVLSSAVCEPRPPGGAVPALCAATALTPRHAGTTRPHMWGAYGLAETATRLDQPARRPTQTHARTHTHTPRAHTHTHIHARSHARTHARSITRARARARAPTHLRSFVCLYARSRALDCRRAGGGPSVRRHQRRSTARLVYLARPPDGACFQ